MALASLARRTALAHAAAWSAAGLAPRAHAATACTGDELGHVPIVEAEGMWLVPVRFDNQPWSMVLDTGAELPVIGQSVAEKLNVAKVTRVTTSSLFGPSTHSAAKVPTFNFAGISLHNLMMPVAYTPLPRFDVLPPAGLLGLSILYVFDLDLDPKRGLLSLYRQSDCQDFKPPWTGSACKIPAMQIERDLSNLTRNAHFNRLWFPEIALPRRRPISVYVDMVVDGTSVRALVDTGSAKTLITKSLADRLGLKQMGASSIIDAAGRSQPAALAAVAETRVGNVVWQNATYLVIDSGNENDGRAILGVDLLRYVRLWFAFKSRQIWMQRA